jgi:tRNA threonylcarbamoyladenosine modification (KEOPS) complex Cgi121 subunit
MQKQGTLTTHAVHSEIVFCLAGSKHIKSSLDTFGVSPSATNLLIAKINATDDDIKLLCEAAGGERVAVREVPIGDEAKMKKTFRCSSQELSIGSILDVAISKGVLGEG